MTYIGSEKVKIDQVKCVHGCAMVIVGEKDALHRLAKEIAYLMHNYSQDSHSEHLTVRMVDKPTSGKLDIKDTLYIFANGGYIDNAYTLVQQRIEEGFKVEIETGIYLPWTREYRYEPAVKETILDDGLGDLDEHPF